jgi:GNAT superfamily N-acetyltransferase
MAAQIEIRRAQPADAADISRVLYESFLEYRPLYTDGGFAATTPNPQQVLQRMREGPVWVALRVDVILGTVAAVIKDESVYIRGMAVLPSTRAAGTGSALLREVENWAISEGHRRMFLSTTPFLHSAIRLYGKFGFQQTDAGLHDLFGTPLFTMQKVIPS